MVLAFVQCPAQRGLNRKSTFSARSLLLQTHTSPTATTAPAQGYPAHMAKHNLPRGGGRLVCSPVVSSEQA